MQPIVKMSWSFANYFCCYFHSLECVFEDPFSPDPPTSTSEIFVYKTKPSGMEPNKLTVKGNQIVGVLDPCHNSVGIHNYMGMWHAYGNLFAFHIKSWLQSRSLQPLQEIPKQNPPSPIQVAPKKQKFDCTRTFLGCRSHWPLGW